MDSNFDIFISYRRKDSAGSDKGVHLARTIKQYLEIKGYRDRVFFDYSEISNEDFPTKILSVIKQTKVFISILTPDSMLRCVNEDDWVRREILEAKENNLQIIFVNPDGKEITFPSDFPDELAFVKTRNHLTVHMDSSFERDMDALIEKHIAPIASPINPSKAGKYAKVRISTDLDCIVYRFDQVIGSANVGEYSMVYLPKGKHKLTFMAADGGSANVNVSVSHSYEVKDVEYEDYIDVSLKEKYNQYLRSLRKNSAPSSSQQRKIAIYSIIGVLAVLLTVLGVRAIIGGTDQKNLVIVPEIVQQDTVVQVKDATEKQVSYQADVLEKQDNKSSNNAEKSNATENDKSSVTNNNSKQHEKKASTEKPASEQRKVSQTKEKKTQEKKSSVQTEKSKASQSSSVSNGSKLGTINGHEYVDLGLPSGLKWATCNIGASSPEEYGDYYAWGEVETKSTYDYSNSATSGRSMSDISGNPTYDVVRKKWGSSWRLPTRAEFQELLDKCRWQWTTQNGKWGCRVTGPNGNSIFLPAAGCSAGSSLYFVGEHGRYCSSSPDEHDDYYFAYRLYFYRSCRGVDGYHRDYGRSVRPVSE